MTNDFFESFSADPEGEKQQDEKLQYSFIWQFESLAKTHDIQPSTP